MEQFPEFPGFDAFGLDPASVLGGVSLDTPKGRAFQRELAEDMLAVEQRRDATVSGVRTLYESLRTDEAAPDEQVAAAAHEFLNAIARAGQTYKEASVAAGMKLVEHITDGKISSEMVRSLLARRLESERLPDGPSEKMQACPEFRRYVLDHVDPDVSPDETIAIGLVCERRDDGVQRVCIITGEGETADESLYFDAFDNYIGDEPPPEPYEPEPHAVEPTGPAIIEGIDLSATYDPDKNGRKLRDFDGGFGEKEE